MEHKPNFKELVGFNPALDKYFNDVTQKYDFFNSNQGLIDFSQTALEKYFSLKIKIDPHRLCPRIYNRVDYVEFVLQLMNLYSCETQHFINRQVKRYLGLDVGTGHTAIYPLLTMSIIDKRNESGSKVNETIDLKFIGSDIDSKSVCLAKENIILNEKLISGRIEIVEVSPSRNELYSYLLRRLNLDGEADRLAFVMCNPPFYSSMSELEEKESFKKQSPLSGRVQATNNELITPGGEVQFITDLIEESVVIQGSKGVDRIKWYTSLVGNFASITVLTKALRERSISNFGVHQFKSSEKKGGTRRWIVYWSFDLTWRPPGKFFNVEHEKNHCVRNIDTRMSYSEVVSALESLPQHSLQYESKQKAAKQYLIKVKFKEIVWTRTYRRSLKNGDQKRRKIEAQLDVDISISAQLAVSLNWRGGESYSNFESFCGWLNGCYEFKKGNKNKII
ncbi:hypothetical protein CANARDRAFT_15376 [[Candida] arabinofermentans NRRL YB-2248]|uniref:U6 small nuclear RNA (adenine-(43)-N(6))-methyltransferase n=1 Tax=[Candida] arabinofermentans NRRL YB-2248 TaxID=983967 RepID=A0A1E4T8P2_9ASCO|nr:hypothetical protein CANARDRAFT_15376 [[Candida] arabinofermentans NRRL YB-2248]